MSKTPEIFVSVDIEADGRVPGLSSMLSFAGAAFTIEKKLLGTFSANLELLPEGVPHPETTQFWNESPENQQAYAMTRVDMRDPKEAMEEFVGWCSSLPGTPVFVGYPAVFDFKWIDYYCHRYVGVNPFGFSRSVDVKSFAWAVLGGELRRTTKRNMPKSWFDPLPHTHIALDDAVEQGAMFINMLRATQKLPAIPAIVREADHAAFRKIA